MHTCVMGMPLQFYLAMVVATVTNFGGRCSMLSSFTRLLMEGVGISETKGTAIALRVKLNLSEKKI